jgi:Zn-dependent protease with chaperone function
VHQFYVSASLRDVSLHLSSATAYAKLRYTPPQMIYLSAVLMLLPLGLTLGFRDAALRHTGANRAATWLGYRRLNRCAMLVTVAGWSAMWDLSRRSYATSSWLNVLAPLSSEMLLFWFPPLIGLGLYSMLCYSTDRTILNLRWSPWHIVGQAWWRIASFVVPLLMIAVGFNAIFDGNGAGVAWIVCAGVVARIGTAFLHRAEGMKLHQAKSGELRNHAFSVARKMGTKIQRVYIVAEGKGHLTNAFGGSGAIGVTDNWGKHFSRSQMDFVIAHEVAHVKFRHGRKEFLFNMLVFSALTLLLWRSRLAVGSLRPVLDFGVVFAPMMAMYMLSRHFEYAADREAVNFAGDSETAVRALASLYKVNAVPIRCSRLTELFLTHPALSRRARAIARLGQLPAGRVADILRATDISANGPSHQ